MFNFLSMENRLIAAALFPPEDIRDRSTDEKIELHARFAPLDDLSEFPSMSFKQKIIQCLFLSYLQNLQLAVFIRSKV